MKFLNDPFFWAFLSMIGWALAPLVVGSKTFGKYFSFGMICWVFAEIPRIILPLPFIDQPRFSDNWILTIIGIVILVISLIFGMSAFSIHPLTRTNKKEKLQTKGFYSIVRHPIMFCDSFWPLGLALICGSIIGLIMFFLWALYIYLFTFFEDEKLIAEYGDEYKEYKKRVPRIIPFIKFL